MIWADRLVSDLDGAHVVNDSKTPSGPVHVGSLRGVLIHDAVYRALASKGLPAHYRFGTDDYDPLDELPAGTGDTYRQYLGLPLCNVPPPLGSTASDFADHYISEFFEIFRELGVGAATYRMRDIYRSGEFDQEIDTILRNSHVVRRIDREVSNARRDDDWFPFQVICERCGRIGTTKVFDYDGEQVSYRCLPNLVKWAEGCGHTGRVSPFRGNGKLSWKLEWVAKWHKFPVTIEGAGKDHNTRGGSREVAVRCLEEIFGQQAPLNVPYEFFLVRGAKMSSSRGVGTTAREMADLLPPEVLRFLLIRALPSKTVDFAPTEEKITRLFKDFDLLREQAASGGGASSSSKINARLYDFVQVRPEPYYYAPPFDLLLSLVQLPHLDITSKVESLKGAALSALEQRHLDQRINSARYWLANFATDAERLELKESVPEQARSLSATQVAFLHRLADAVATTDWSADAVQARIFDVARQTPLEQRAAFSAIYTILFGRNSGPRAGNLITFLDRAFVLDRFRAVPYSVLEFWRESSLSAADLEVWLKEAARDRKELSARAAFEGIETEADGDRRVDAAGVVEFTASGDDGRTHLRRYQLLTVASHESSLAAERARFTAEADRYLAELAERLPVTHLSPRS